MSILTVSLDYVTKSLVMLRKTSSVFNTDSHKKDFTMRKHDTVREELRFWPYTIHQIDDTLDSSLIEGRAKQLLFLSLIHI